MNRSVYCKQEMQEYLVKNVQNPAKIVLLNLSDKKVSGSDVYNIFRIFKSLKDLPEPALDNIGDNLNHRILVETRDEFFRHWNIPSYAKIFRLAFNYLIKKISFDHLYESMFNWFLGELYRRGYKLPEHNVPDHPTWDKIPKETDKKLRDWINYNYDFLQARLNNPDDPVGKEGRRKQFVNRIMDAFEKEVEAWR